MRFSQLSPGSIKANSRFREATTAQASWTKTYRLYALLPTSPSGSKLPRLSQHSLASLLKEFRSEILRVGWGWLRSTTAEK